MRTKFSGLCLAVVLLAAAAGCSGDSSPDSKPSPPGPGPVGGGSSPPPSVAPDRTPVDLVTGLHSPWGVAVLPDGGALVSDRDAGTVSLLPPAGGPVVAVGPVPGSAHRGEGGLLGLALSPAFAQDHLVYAYLTTASDNRIVRMTYEGGKFGEQQPVLSGIPSGSNHNGGRIAFGPDGMLYAGTGEGGDKPLAQDNASLGGKILRMTPDGRPAPGNPFPDSVVYSLGHRNVQGLAWDAAGRLWAGEFGQTRFDELNLITPGGNYGWPIVEGRSNEGRFVRPVVTWGPTSSASPSGIAILGDSLYVACLAGKRLFRVPLQGETAGEPVEMLKNRYGRLRTVVTVGNDLWITTSNTDGRGDKKDGDDRILKITPG